MAPNSIPAAAGLSVIALVSGGKDSFFSALHCLENGHRLVALANLHPPLANGSVPASASASAPAAPTRAGPEGSDLAPPASLDSATPGSDRGAGGISNRLATIAATSSEHDGPGGPAAETDLNSFMYQTVGHQVIPLYAEATGIPLYRRAISGGALQSGRDYSTAFSQGVSALHGDEDEDETESMIPLLQAVIREHPEANALSAGAILSTYQRTRVESVALRLGLTPLAYLWKYPVLPPPLSTSKDEAQLLFDMAAAGLEARIIKVASGGLDESFLWEKVASARGIMRLKKAMSRFGSAGMDTGAVIGEGGEFETLVVDGPKTLFKRRVVVAEDARTTVNEGGGTAWLSFGTATLEQKDEGGEEEGQIRKPDLLDARFAAVLETLQTSRQEDVHEESHAEDEVSTELIGRSRRDEYPLTLHQDSKVETWAFTGSQMSTPTTIQEETSMLIRNIQERLSQRDLAPSSILSTVIVLRSMTDFPAINAVYGSLLLDPNPPSRVTISCGDLLPLSSGNIAIYVTLPSSSSSPEKYINRRDGLHVQSRSYWAPANIGPYSQAITFPASLLSSDDYSSSSMASRIVHIAGQIPLVPASMGFIPLEAGGSLEMQLVLSLQHLWRIGVEMGVQWWTSAAVYFPSRRRSTCPLSAREKALLAWRAWKEAHEWKVGGSEEEDDDDESGPDLWDRKFNSKYMSYTGEAAGGNNGTPDLPDHLLFDDETDGKGGRRRRLPYFFAVEVDELPRSAEAEWHAHAGLSGIRSGTDSLLVSRWKGSIMSSSSGGGGDGESSSSSPNCELSHCVLTSTFDSHPDQDGTDEKVVACLHSVVAVESHPPQDDNTTTTTTTTKMTLQETLSQANRAFCASLTSTTTTAATIASLPQDQQQVSKPYLLYVDTEDFSPEEIAGVMEGGGGGDHGGGLAVVPCKNIHGYDCDGGSRGATRLGVVVLCRHFLS